MFSAPQYLIQKLSMKGNGMSSHKKIGRGLSLDVEICDVLNCGEQGPRHATWKQSSSLQNCSSMFSNLGGKARTVVIVFTISSDTSKADLIAELRSQHWIQDSAIKYFYMRVF